MPATSSHRPDRREGLLRFLSWALALSYFYFGPDAEQDSSRSYLSRVKLTKVFCGFDVAPRPARDILLFIEGKLPADFRGRSEDERARRNFRPDRDERVRTEDGACADLYIIENNRAHPNKHFIVDFAGVHDSAVAHGNQLAYGRWIICVQVNNSIILNVRARSNDDAVDVAAQHGPVPNARFFCERDVANYRCAGDNPRA